MKDNYPQKCPIFPDLVCPQGPKASQACTVRVSGDFDPVLYFKDHLIVHCAIHRNQERIAKETSQK